MTRDTALKCALIAIGALFSAGIYPLVMSLWDWRHSNDIVPMFLSIYVTLGILLLIAARDPPAHRSVISFAAWSSFAHMAVMLVQADSDVAGRPELYGMSAVLLAIGVSLSALAPAKRAAELPEASAN